MGPTTTVGADDPCHRASAIPGRPRALLSRQARTEGAWADDFELTATTVTLVIPVTWPPQCRGTFHDGSRADCHHDGAALVDSEDKADSQCKELERTVTAGGI